MECLVSLSSRLWPKGSVVLRSWFVILLSEREDYSQKWRQGWLSIYSWLNWLSCCVDCVIALYSLWLVSLSICIRFRLCNGAVVFWIKSFAFPFVGESCYSCSGVWLLYRFILNPGLRGVWYPEVGKLWTLSCWQFIEPVWRSKKRESPFAAGVP